MKSRNEHKTTQSIEGSLPEKIRPRDLGRLNEALAYVFQELGEATTLHQKGANAGREGVIHSVETTIKFLQLFDPVISRRLQAPLSALFTELMSLDDGRVSPLLKAAKKSGRARATAMRGSLIGGAVFTVRRLTETGMRAKAAHKAVAGTLSAIGVAPARGRRGKITERTVRGWCEDVDADVGRHGEAAQSCDLLLGDPRGSVNGLSPKEAQTALLDRLAAAAQAIRAQEGD